MADKVTTMVLKVDLHCSTCYKKIKKLLCKFPQIRNQVYDEKANTVRITVVCCNPEKMRDKLCCKGGKTIKSIEIIKETRDEKPKDKEQQKKGDEKPKDKEQQKKDKEQQKGDEKPNKDKEVPPGRVCCPQCSEGHYGGPCYQGYRRPVSCYDGCRCGCGYGYCYDYGYCQKKICYVSMCDYVHEENTSGCTIM